MAEMNGHAIELEASAAELDVLLADIFQPVAVEIGPGRAVLVRPLLLEQADALYSGGLAGASLQRYLLARCVYVAGKPIGEQGAARLPIILANKLVPIVMRANGMKAELEEGPGAAAVDPLS